jgi:hypothetical protein
LAESELWAWDLWLLASAYESSHVLAFG